MKTKVTVLRINHRLYRDFRVSEHCALVARAFGADGIIFSGEHDKELLESIKKVVEKWGNHFEFKYEKDWKKIILNWKNNDGIIIHTTMYGELIQNVIKKLRDCINKKNILIIIGSAKVQKEVYELADFNVAVSSQPHSEIAALAITLDWLFEGKEFDKEFNGKIKIIPSKKGKNVQK